MTFEVLPGSGVTSNRLFSARVASTKEVLAAGAEIVPVALTDDSIALMWRAADTAPELEPMVWEPGRPGMVDLSFLSSEEIMPALHDAPALDAETSPGVVSLAAWRALRGH